MSAAQARAALDLLLAEPRPCTMDKARDAFLALVTLRARLRDDPEALARVNAAIALTWSGVIPVAGFKPGRLEKARAYLDGLPG